MEPADGELIRRIRESPDPASKNAALTELLSRHHPAMLRTATALLAERSGHSLQPEDVVQQAIAEVLLEKLHLFDTTRPFPPWLVVVVRNVGRDLLRDEHPHAQLGEQAPAAAEEDDLASIHEQVEQLLATVSEAERRLLRLFYLEELSAQEVAGHLGVGAQQVYRKLHRIRLRLRAGASLCPQAE